MEQLKDIIHNCFIMNRKISANNNAVFNFYSQIIKSNYIILPLHLKKNQDFLDNIDSLEIEYWKPIIQGEEKNLTLIEILMESFETEVEDQAAHAVNTLKSNFAILKRSEKNLENYFDSLKIMNKLINSRNDPTFSQIRNHNKVGSSRKSHLNGLKFLNAIYEKHNVEVTYFSISNNEVRLLMKKKISFREQDDKLKIMKDLNALKNIELQQEEEIKKLHSFKDKKTMSKIYYLLLKQEEIYDLMGHSSNYLGQLKLHRKYDVKTKISKINSNFDCMIDFKITIPLLDFYKIIADL